MSDRQFKQPNVNEGIISGNLTRDVKMKYTQDGTAIAAFGVANNKKWKDKDTGEWKERVRFFEVEAWAALADTCEKTLEKGCPVLINFELDYDQWTDKTTGDKRHGTRLVARRVQRLDWADDDATTGRTERLAPRPIEEPIPEDDYPF